MAAKSAEVAKFEQLSKQRMDYTNLPGGGVRARLTITLPGGKTMSFVEDVTPDDVDTYAAQISGVEIGYAISEVGGVVEVGFLSSLVKTIGKGVKAVANVAKKVVTSKVMQTAAKGLALAAPALGPLAPAALGVAGGIGVAGKLLSAKNAAAVGAKRTAAAITQDAISDARRISPNASSSLLRIASSKANSAQRLLFPQFGAKTQAISKALARGQASNANVLELARQGRIRSNLGGAVTPAQLMAAQQAGRMFFLTA